ncbi:uncharacterized protein LOC131880528 isoform X2 [Tigriopus californicus]|uniref:uncharacterized protein LOC131880528 isoform X2 n=1 Tax=Tigriopus californicus TaxID=6832 RepID=UPI0027D9F5A7|nr:uncharacterized protein LOC131880528 isoform X2 [Tigriopus californicus]
MRFQTLHTLQLFILTIEILFWTRTWTVTGLMQCQTGSSPVPIPYQVYGSVALMAVRKAETKYKNAKRACKNAQSDGILPMPKSEAVALALKGKMEEENDGEIWIGLTNSNDDDCVNAGCNSNLQWEDGSSFEYQSWMGYLSVDEDDECFRLSYGSNIISGSCDQWIEGHICQFDCDGVIEEVNATCPMGAPIPQDFQPQGDKWFKILPDIVGTKIEAEVACSVIGGRLPTITTQDSYDAITEILKFATRETWLDMNPVTTTCQDEECSTKHQWNNGQPFLHSSSWYDLVDFQPFGCPKIRKTSTGYAILTINCLFNASTICEFNCQTPVGITTIATTSTTTTTTTAILTTTETPMITQDISPPPVEIWTGMVPNDRNRDVACQRECAKGNLPGHKCFGKIKDPFARDLSPVLWPCLCMRSKIILAPGTFCGPQGSMCL